MAQELLARNQRWIHAMLAHDVNYLNNLTEEQEPKVLWIGCADSRVPESVITASVPGEIFVHRNIANQLRLDDDNAVSVLEYAVNTLGVDHIIVCGHSECGGCKGALDSLTNNPEGAITTIQEKGDPSSGSALDRWLTPLVELAKCLQDNQIPGNDLTLEDFIRGNVEHQVRQIEKSDVIRNPRSGKRPYVHGWEFKLDKGVLVDLNVTLGPN